MNTDYQLAAIEHGFEIAPVAPFNDLPASGLVFRREPFDDDRNVAIRMEGMVVVRLSVAFQDDEALAEVEALFDAATPCIVAPGFRQWLVHVPHFKVPTGAVGGVGALQFAEVREAALCSPSRLLSSAGTIEALRFVNPENVLPARATDALLQELVRAGKLPHGAADVIRGLEDE